MGSESDRAAHVASLLVELERAQATISNPHNSQHVEAISVSPTEP
jgi:hypothetical protein